MSILNIKHKTVVITGASSGVGLACAQKFAELGANLVLVARGKEKLERVGEQLSKQTQVLTYAMDVGNAQQCNKLMEKCIERFNQIDILVNNAGLHFRGDVMSRQPAELTQMIEINLTAPIRLTAEALPHIKKSTSGAIVMVGSLAGRAPLQGAATYSATKAGLRAFTYALADELKHLGINVGIVSPGPINTGFIMDEIDNVEDIVYSQPMSSAEQVADAVLKIVEGKKNEISMPWFSGKLTTIGYLFPAFRRATRNLLYKIGAKNKLKYKKQSRNVT